MSEIHALSGAYAIDALDDIERAQFERHLAECPDCRDEVDSLREASAVLAEAVAAPPSDALRERLLAEIARVRPLPPLTVTSLPERRRRFRPVALVAAAAAVIALGAGGVAWQTMQDDTTQQGPTLSAVDQVLQAKDAERYTKQLPGGATISITRSPTLNRAVLETSGMEDLPSDKVYEMWFAQKGKGMVPAGLMEAANGTFLMEGDAAEAIGAGITVEPAGGSTEPTLPPVTTLTFENA